MIVTVYSNEIQDIYLTSKVSFSRTFSSWWMCISGKQNSKQTRRSYKPRGGESRVRFETEKRSPFPNKQTRPTARNAQSGPYQKQNVSNRRTRIKIVDEIYGVIVGFQDTAGPSRQGEENPQVEGQKREPYRKEFESVVSVGIQPRYHVKEEHMKTVVEAKNNSGATTRSQTARSVMSSVPSTPDSHVTPDMMRMRENTHRIKQGRCVYVQPQIRATSFPQVPVVQHHTKTDPPSFYIK